MQESKLGLVVTAKQTYYPIELSNSELLAHYETIQEYHQDIASNIIEQSSKYKPDPKLIDQQPEMEPSATRSTIVSFLFELSVVTRVTDGIFFHAVRLYDRYCSKRIVLKDQAQLVVATCLWLSAKTWGGCNHIINNVCVPTGGRFYGPNPRARIPRLSELVHHCGGLHVFDESMFVQMERHILDTLNWDVCEPTINDYILNVDENCLIQYELYKRQLEYNKEWKAKRQSQSTQDSDSTINDLEAENNNEDSDEDGDLDSKIQLINLKRFLIDLSTWQYSLLKYELFELSNGIFSIIDKFTNHDQGPFLMSPPISASYQVQLLNIYINAIINAPESLIEVYRKQTGVMEFISRVKDYHLDLQKKLQLASSLDLSRKMSATIPNGNGTFFDRNASPSSIYSSQSYTPLRNTSALSENSLFSTTSVDQSSPITPQMYMFGQFKTDSDCASTISVNSISNLKNSNNSNANINRIKMDNDDDKENVDPYRQIKMKNSVNSKNNSTTTFCSPSKTKESLSNKPSIMSLTLINTTGMV
ncbi:hypothetical protein TPHA_0D03640 [Tetrapisispora phaffii CBS 4417]|uniref:G1/S-specific cyclin n=1 Tax=Tetrapisispora phaffii (strain ATCC 24235 / CBS 4417 / NBRC 1672 / NRRL Y-8282 / UCD 70-5) TaxID=1071381 RepID=G8BT28_TETPH|nr:hypothetical protein TPHA_0D03640 [Tetrapisispora phaffii CBS 4417]CCE62999.1 hypothetical protein TPHA_0D03640 [Tetrapisispora phaffii CBS 4417]